MNPCRGHESNRHREAKERIASLFDESVWSVFFEQRCADLVVLHRATRFVAAIEIESTPRNVLRNLKRNTVFGCNAVAVLGLDERYFNQIANKLEKRDPSMLPNRIRLFAHTAAGMEDLHRWFEALAAERSQP